MTHSASDHPGMREDWVRFLCHREKLYWNEMRDFVRALGFQSAIVGTMVRSSSANSQSGLDAMDNHAYVNYPSLGENFRNNSDLKDWTMEHKAIVNSPLAKSSLLHSGTSRAIPTS